jgi:hypothetical protein
VATDSVNQTAGRTSTAATDPARAPAEALTEAKPGSQEETAAVTNRLENTREAEGAAADRKGAAAATPEEAAAASIEAAATDTDLNMAIKSSHTHPQTDSNFSLNFFPAKNT